MRVLKKRENRLEAEQAGLKTLVAGLVGSSALLKAREREWRQRFGGEEKDEVERKTSTPAMDGVDLAPSPTCLRPRDPILVRCSLFIACRFGCRCVGMEGIRADVPSLRVYCRFGEFCSHAGDWEEGRSVSFTPPNVGAKKRRKEEVVDWVSVHR